MSEGLSKRNRIEQLVEVARATQEQPDDYSTKELFKLGRDLLKEVKSRIEQEANTRMAIQLIQTDLPIHLDVRFHSLKTEKAKIQSKRQDYRKVGR